MAQRWQDDPVASAFLAQYMEASRQRAAREAQELERRDLTTRLLLQDRLRQEEGARERAREAGALSTWMSGKAGRPEVFGLREGQVVTPEQAPTFGEFAKKRSAREESVSNIPIGSKQVTGLGEEIAVNPIPEIEDQTPAQPHLYVPVPAQDKFGRQITKWQPLTDKYRVHAERLFSAGVEPHSEAWKQSMAKYANQITVGENVKSASDMAMPQGMRGPVAAPAPGAPPQEDEAPNLAIARRGVSSETAMQLQGSMRTKEAAVRMKQIIMAKPELIQSYMGKIHQYKGEAQRWGAEFKRFGVPMPGPFGEVPPEEFTNLERDLNALTNYTVRLITGAQMNKEEVPRIKGQIPTLGLQLPEFNRRLDATIQEIQLMERRVVALALTNDQEARLFAEQNGIPVPNKGPAPAGVTGQPPTQAPKKPLPVQAPAQSPSGAAKPSFGEWKKNRR